MSENPQIQQTDDLLDAELQKALTAAFGAEAAEWVNEESELDNLSIEEMLALEAEQSNDEPTNNLLADLMETLSAEIDSDTPLSFGLDAEFDIDDEEAAETETGERHVVFQVGDQLYGVPLDGVREIDRCGKVTSLPRTPSWLRGVTNLRGQILSVTDFRNLLGLVEHRKTIGEKIVVVHSDLHDTRTALVVDRIYGIRNLSSEQKSFDGLSDRIAGFAHSIAFTDQTSTVLIDPDRLLGCDELKMFATE